jgi:hypothetical protein
VGVGWVGVPLCRYCIQSAEEERTMQLLGAHAPRCSQVDSDTSLSPRSLCNSSKMWLEFENRASHREVSDNGISTSNSLILSVAGRVNGSCGPRREGRDTCTRDPSSCNSVELNISNERGNVPWVVVYFM